MPLDSLDIYILKPKAATNMVTNPSVERDTTGYTAVNGSISRVSTQQRRGAYSLQITPNTGVESGAYFGTVSLTNGVLYTFSADILGVSGHTYSIQIRTTGGSVLAQTTFTGTGYWQRKSVTYTETSTNSRRLYIVRSAVASTTPFYLDGFQCEAGNESSYIDGDLNGYLRNSKDYGWNGVPHGSASWRSGQTRHGGEYMKLNSFLTILGIVGLGMSTITSLQTDVSTGGALYQKSTMDVREFGIQVLFRGDRWRDIQQARNKLIGLIRPDSTTIQQPLTLVLQGKDSSGQENTERVVIPCVYMAGLEGVHDNQTAEKCNLQFKQYFPLILADGERASNILVNASQSLSLMARRRPDGTWQGAGTITGTYITVIKYNPYDGRVYVGGNNITNFGGVSTNGIAAYDPASGSWSALGSGAPSGSIVRAIDIDASGNVYVIGNFASMGGAANSANIARWNIASGTWTGLNSGLGGTSPALLDVHVAPDGSIYVAGRFTSINGVSATNIARYNGSVWSALGWSSGDGVVVRASRTGIVYLAHSSSPFISYYNGSSWTGMSGWTSIAPTTPPEFLAFDKKGRLWASERAAVYWSGTQWVREFDNSPSSRIHLMKFDDAGRMWIAGNFTWLGTSELPTGAAMVSGNILSPLDISGAILSDIVAMDVLPNGEVYIGGAFSGTATSGTVSVNNNSSAVVYPVFRVTGPGTLWSITNYTTGKALYTNRLTLAAGETAEISLVPGNVYAKSSLKGNIISYFIPGTDFMFPVVPGDNNISLFMTGTDANSLAIMYYRDTYWSLDGASR